MPKKLTTKEFIQKSKKIHGNKYGYDKTTYTGCNSRVQIKCKHHGYFLQMPPDHLDGHGCRKCFDKKTSIRCKSNTSEFIKKAEVIHFKFYNYEKVKYITNHNKIIITCPIHGDFLQTPYSHLNGHGCKSCQYKKSLHLKISKKETDFLSYLNIPVDNRQVLIGTYTVDAAVKNTIIEFLGDYWHGNIDIIDPSKLQEVSGKTFREIHDHTFKRFDILKKFGYHIIYVWESDWDNFHRGKTKSLKINTYE